MSFTSRTPSGGWRANWRDPSGKQKAKTFKTKREALAFLAEIESSMNRGQYVSPHAGKSKFGPYALEWLASRTTEKTTAAGESSVMRNHVIPKWGEIPMGKITHSAVQAWVTSLGQKLGYTMVSECLRLTSSVLRAAVRDQIIGANPCEGVRLPKRQKSDSDARILAPADLPGLLAEVPERYRALVAVAVGAGLRWGECVGLRRDVLDLDSEQPTLRVSRTLIEIGGHVSAKPYPKSRAGRRDVPLPPFVVTLLRKHIADFPPKPAGELFTNRDGGPLWRSTFRSRVWRPALVRAGLLGKVVQVDETTFRAEWLAGDGLEQHAEFSTHDDAVTHVVRHAAGGLRFHDLRHSYATWLVSSGVPINDVASVMGHEQTSTTLNRYTHRSDRRDSNVRGAFADFSLTDGPEETPESTEDPSEEES